MTVTLPLGSKWVTYTCVPSGDIATRYAPAATWIVATMASESTSITETVSLPRFETKAFVPSGENTTSRGDPPPTIVPTLVLVATSMTDRVLVDALVT